MLNILVCLYLLLNLDESIDCDAVAWENLYTSVNFVFRYHFQKYIFYFSQQQQKNWFLNGNSFGIRYVFNSIDKNCFIQNHFEMIAWKMKWKPSFMAVFGVNHWLKINHPVKIISYRMKWLRGKYRNRCNSGGFL